MKSEKSVTEVARNFSAYLNRVAFNRETIVLLRGKKAVAELTPVPMGASVAELPDLLASLPRLEPQEAIEFEADLDRARNELRTESEHDPWASS